MGKGKKTVSGWVVELRTSFEVTEKLEAFYTGGQVQLSSDGEYLFTCCGSAVKALHVNSGVVEHSFEEEEDSVVCFVLSPDSQVLVVSWRSQQLKQYQWDGKKGEGVEGGGMEGIGGEGDRGKCVRSWRPLQGSVVAMAIDSTSTLLATGSSSGIKVWDCAQHYCTHNLRPSGGLVGLLAFHPSPTHLTLFSSTSSDTSIKVWDLKSSKCVAVLKGHVSAVTSIGFSEDRTYMISAGRDQVLHVWNLAQYTLHKTLPVFEAVEGVVVLSRSGLLKGDGDTERKESDSVRDSLLVATAGGKGVIRVWDVLKGKISHSLEPLPRPPRPSTGQEEEGEKGEEDEEEDVPQVYTDLFLSESRAALVGVTYDHNILFYDLVNFKKEKQLLGYCDEILDMRFLGSGSSARMAVATNSEHVKIFHRESLDCQILHGHSRVVLALDVCSWPPPHPLLLVTSSKDHTLRVWEEEADGSEFVCKGVGLGHTEAVGAVALARISGSFVVSGSQDCTIKLWSIKNLSKWKPGDHPLKLSVKYTQLAHDKDINSVDVSPNDKLIATGSQDKTAKLWRVSDGSAVGVLKGHRRGIWSVQFSPVDQCVLTASGDTTLKLWAVSDCSCIKTFEGHTMSVLKGIFLTRGMQIASSGSDGLVKVWTIKTNECVATLDRHTEKVWSVASSDDGQWLASGGADSLICIWKDITEKVEAEKQEAKEKQILQEQELSNYLQQKDYVSAVGVAINLDQPVRVHTILSELLDEGGAEGAFRDTLTSLTPDQLQSILRYLTKWNMNTKYSTVAQTVLSHVLKSHTPEQLMKFGGLHSILEGLIPYTERHFQRLSRLLQLSMFVDYTWQCMKLPDQFSATGSEMMQTAKDTLSGSVMSGHSDVTVAVADSTTNDEVPLFVEDPNPDPTLHKEAVGGSEESSDVEADNKETSSSDSECEVTNSHSLHTHVEELDLVTRNRVVEAEPVGVEEEHEKDEEGKRKSKESVKRKRRKGLRKVYRVIKWRGVSRLRASRSRLACRSNRVKSSIGLSQQTPPNH